MTLEGWAYLMYAVQDGYNYYASAAFFVVVILFGSFFVINLFVAVIYDAFMQHMQQGSVRKEGEGAVDETPAQAAVGRLSRRLSSISAEEIARVLQEDASSDGRSSCDGRSSVLSAVPEDRSKRTSVPATAWVETGGAGSLEGHRTVFETNEFLDLPVSVIYYGKLQVRAEARRNTKWTCNPQTVLTFIRKFCEDNMCEVQIEEAVRLYAQTCGLGMHKGSTRPVCWNGLSVCVFLRKGKFPGGDCVFPKTIVPIDQYLI